MKRSRAPNFSEYEVMHLLKLIKKYTVIESKQIDGATTFGKRMAWRSLADEYNTTTPEGPRTIESLMACYRNQKNKRKQMNTDFKVYAKDGDSFAKASNVMVISSIEQSSDSSQEELLSYDGEFPCIEQTSDNDIQEVDALANNESNDSASTTPPKSLPESYDKGEFCTSQNEIKLPAEVTVTTTRLGVKNHEPDPEARKIINGKKMKTSEWFVEEKDDLRKIRRQTALDQLQHQKQINALNLQIVKEKLDFEQKTKRQELDFQRNKQEIELSFLKEKYALELDLLRNKEQ